MVLRERKISCKSDAVQLQVSFGVPDVTALLRIYAGLLTYTRGDPQTENGVIYWLEHSDKAFAQWPQKWREQLSRWAFCVAVRNKLLIPTATNENQYFLADCLFVKRGRPKKEE